MDDCAGKLTQKTWFDLGEEYYHGATLKECEAKFKVSVYCIAKCLTEITGVEMRPRGEFEKATKSSKAEYEKETLTPTGHQEYASGCTPGDPAEEPSDNPRKIIGV
jgi:hypothetical protein